MQRYRNKAVEVPRGLSQEELEALMDKLGDSGWRLTVIEQQQSGRMFYFTREMQERKK